MIIDIFISRNINISFWIILYTNRTYSRRSSWECIVRNEEDLRISTKFTFAGIVSITRRIYENLNRHDEIENCASGSEIYSIIVIDMKKFSWENDDTNIVYANPLQYAIFRTHEKLGILSFLHTRYFQFKGIISRNRTSKNWRALNFW